MYASAKTSHLHMLLTLSYAELPAVYAEELVPLLESSFNVFWSTVLYNETVLPFCDTFLRYAPRVEVTDDGCRSGWSGAGGQWEVRELERCREWEEEAKVEGRKWKTGMGEGKRERMRGRDTEGETERIRGTGKEKGSGTGGRRGKMRG